MGLDSPARNPLEDPMATNPETGSEIEYEDNGDFTITFSMTLPPQPAPSSDDNEEA